jgi:hypothetical protein
MSGCESETVSLEGFAMMSQRNWMSLLNCRWCLKIGKFTESTKPWTCEDHFWTLTDIRDDSCENDGGEKYSNETWDC